MLVHCILCCNDKVILQKRYRKDDIINAYTYDPLFNGIQIDVVEDISCDLNLYRCMDCDLRFYEPSITGNSNFYSKLQVFPWYYQLVKPEFEFTKKYIGADDTVLEIGCGEGYFGSMIGSNYIGLDPFSKNPKVIKQNIEKHTGIYDVVCGFQVLEHVSDTRSFISNALRCTRRNGLLIISVPNEDSFLGNIEGWALNYPPHHVTRFTKHCLNNIAKLFDLKLITLDEEPLLDFHRNLLDSNKYSTIDSNINYNIGHTMIAVYKKI